MAARSVGDVIELTAEQAEFMRRVEAEATAKRILLVDQIRETIAAIDQERIAAAERLLTEHGINLGMPEAGKWDLSIEKMRFVRTA